MKFSYAKYAALGAFLIATSLHNKGHHNSHIQSHKKSAEKHIMAVFIHGTMLPLPNFKACTESFKQLFASNKQKTTKSWYQGYLDNLKLKSIYRYQPSGPDGLHRVTGQQSAHIAATMFQEFYTTPCSCYTFSWDGRLSSRHRKETAQLLYRSLSTEVESLKKIHHDLEVVLICHSHGGNVALNLANIQQQQKPDLNINKLVLLGTPVQSETSDCISGNCFKKVYNFFSHGDKVQKLDIISTADRASARRFDEHPKLMQIELSCGIVLPRHNELWLFGGKDNWLYRHKKLSLEPFPFFVFLPTVLNELDKHYPTASYVALDITKDPQRLLFSFSDKKNQHSCYIEQEVLKKYHAMVNAY